MALVADVMPVDAACIAALFFMADAALHLDILVKIFERSLAYQAFLIHRSTSLDRLNHTISRRKTQREERPVISPDPHAREAK
jgi:hypothetical protein